MNRILTALLAALIICLPARADEANLLLWWFDDPAIAEIDGRSEPVHVSDGTLVGRGDAAGLEPNAIRISATKSSGEKVYLFLGEGDFFGMDAVAIPGEMGGKPVWGAGPCYADLSGLDLSDTGIRFAMEIGNYQYDEASDLVTWTVMAMGSNTLEELREHYIRAERSYQQSDHWSGGQFSVPEPTSGLLVLIGGALLALRRKRKGEAA